MDYKLIIFDVDGTLTTTKSGATFRKSADDWKWLPGRHAKIAMLHLHAVKLALASNQAGVAFPWSQFTEAEMQAELEAMAREMNIGFVAVCYTTPNIKALSQYHNPNDKRRKPGCGMLLEAMEHYSVETKDTLFVGDRAEDEQAAIVAGIDFMWASDFFEDKPVPDIDDPF